ncbi:MAG TPA: hypothetical protein VGD10_12740 [Allosphingosinicella sp.]|uniref:TolB family protein n=1 Tax=Allosphingosinicella sp. TaxID=2823234 RepID=UPI002EDB90EE
MLKPLAAVAALALAGAAPEPLQFVNSPLNEYNPSFDRPERLMVFARSEAEFRNAKIYVSQKRRGKWAAPAQIGFSDPRYSDSDPWLTPDGRTLYFVSDRPTASRPDKKDLDLWRSRLVRGVWSAPEHLGDAVNSPNPELGPELHGGILYFASVRRGGKGGLDIYTAREAAGGFGPAEALAGPFNSAQSDSDFTISPDGRHAAFWRGLGDGTARIMLSRRLAAGWSEPAPLPASVNLGPFNFTPRFSRDGKSLWLASTLERQGQERGMADIYVRALPPL